MPSKLSRFIAVLLLVIPGWIATYGFLKMKDAVFASFGPPAFPWLDFALGLVLFAFGVAFVGGWIFYRDRKRNYVAPRFREKKKQRR
ncbi:DUF2627 domain-containing protein [Paenibacillus alkalitolerans]|uniref:DUF2627 domain-containing protein n=1 Tax=Paenibacillus alkalitolerans TaxID=2799335 RepID=UPI0018F50D1B|nr:DUF2627 domain-containing protein [Paenibacillus alkalitolerans]